jgi:S-adenosylmethionine:tRNA ribosyltransferase-isomerase
MTVDLNNISAWQYDLPEKLIASRPTVQRDGARLMVVDRKTQSVRHHTIRDLPNLLHSGDQLVFNNTQVIPARLFGYRTKTKGRWEGLFLNQPDPHSWRITGQTRGKLHPGETLTIHPPEQSSPVLTLSLIEQLDDGSWLVQPESDGDSVELLRQFGTLPLPPYIGRAIADEQDADRYQTIFAERPGAIAAPTAGLHFTPALLNALTEQQIEQARVTLHVGIGTFRPVKSGRLSEHEMHSEWCEVTDTTAANLAAAQASGSNIVAVGTTSVRTLESACRDGQLQQFKGSTNLFIRPGYEFQVVDQLLTNFHLPGSTLIVLVAALAGYELTMDAYRTAVREGYRFYSYGDAMLIV